MIWFTSDQHYGHDKVIGFSQRPFIDLADMNAGLIQKYRAKVRPHDICYFVGDVFFCGYIEAHSIMEQLPGRKILIQGNHDKFSQKQYISLGFEIVAEEMVVRLFGRRIKLCHYPRTPTLWDKLRSKFMHNYDYRYPERRPPYDGRWLIHGHTHGKDQINVKKKTIHVGVDAWNYAPVGLKQIESMIAKAEM